MSARRCVPTPPVGRPHAKRRRWGPAGGVGRAARPAALCPWGAACCHPASPACCHPASPTAAPAASLLAPPGCATYAWVESHPRCGGPTCYLKGEVRPRWGAAFSRWHAALVGWGAFRSLPSAEHPATCPAFLTCTQAALVTCQRNVEGVIAGRRNPLGGTPPLCSVVKPALIEGCLYTVVPDTTLQGGAALPAAQASPFAYRCAVLAVVLDLCSVLRLLRGLRAQQGRGIKFGIHAPTGCLPSHAPSRRAAGHRRLGAGVLPAVPGHRGVQGIRLY